MDQEYWILCDYPGCEIHECLGRLNTPTMATAIAIHAGWRRQFLREGGAWVERDLCPDHWETS